MSISGLLFWGLLLLVLLVISPTLRRRLFREVIFPIGYSIYTSDLVGYSLHRLRFMSSASKPAVPHSKIDTVQTYGKAALVDPADPYPITTVLKEQFGEYKLTHILTTHKHWDHAGGNVELVKQYPSLVVIGGAGDSVAGATRECTTGDEVAIASGFKAKVYQCPCHTRGHIIFDIDGLLFTGDTLFAAGCGKFFEGNASEMYKNLYQTIGTLPSSTLIFPGHEYTVSNLEFAIWLEPENEAVKNKFVWAQERRAGKFPTIPTTLQEEKEYNPFLRADQPTVVSRVTRLLNLSGAASGGTRTDQTIRVLDALRTLKNENAHKKKKAAEE